MADATYTSYLHYVYAHLSQILQFCCAVFYIKIRKFKCLYIQITLVSLDKAEHF